MAVTQKAQPATTKGKSFKKKESQESALAGRERKREAKRKGLKPGNRQAAENANQKKGASGQAKDPRVGSRKPVALVVEKPATVAKPQTKPAQDPLKLAAEQEKKRLRALEQEMEAIENDERLNLLLDKLDGGETLVAADQVWLDAQLERHQQLANALGIEDDDEDEQSTPEDLLQRFIDDDFDPSELDPDYKK